MTDKILQKTAEILVECGYAMQTLGHNTALLINGVHYPHKKIDPFSDTLEGRQQADAIEDWICFNRFELWKLGSENVGSEDSGKSHHQWRLYRIKWCLMQLTGDSNE